MNQKDATRWEVLITKVEKVDDWSDDAYLSIDLSIVWEAVAAVEIKILPEPDIYFEGQLRPPGSRTTLRFLFPTRFT